jgi:glycosyltransferase involved in cell wall biosynthesis
MTKKNKKNAIKPEVIVKKKPSVSIVTITQLKRFNCLEILSDLIKDQTYDNITEWVIVEGSKTKEDCDKNKENIQKLKESTKLKIVYVEFKESVKLGELRNIGNKTCTGDITVCMDDDDYYPKDRVEHAVTKLVSSKAKIAGCSAVLIYDYFLNKLYKFKPFGPFHSTNNCMAWKKEYLIDNKHDSDKEMAEEASFTKQFSQELVQLEAEHTIVVSSHDSNTFNKRELLVGGTNKLNPTLSEVESPITEYIKEPYFSKYKNIFVKEGESNYDIVYLAGGFSIKWDPADMSLGGSEQAIVNLVNNWAAKGKKVAVYGEVPEKTFNGVDYINWKKFPFENKHNIVILWRLYGIWAGAPFSIKAKQIYLDCHDNFGGHFPETWKKYGSVINKIFFKSEFHKDEFEKHTGETISKDKYSIISNGIRVEEFRQNKEKVPRNPYRFCYCSCYMRGLKEILQFIWPIIYNYEPRAELHVYYGMNNIRDDNIKNMFVQLLSQPGVMDHGRQPMEIIAREKHMSNYQLYVSNTPIEIDCISIRESLASGCIPLISTYGVFKDREGIHFELNDKDMRCYQAIAIKILQLLKQNENLNGYREKIKQSPLLTTWKETADKWLEHF